MLGLYTTGANCSLELFSLGKTIGKEGLEPPVDTV